MRARRWTDPTLTRPRPRPETLVSYRIAAYRDFIDPPLLEALQGRCVPVPDVSGLAVARGLRSQFPSIETDVALGLVAAVARAVARR